MTKRCSNLSLIMSSNKVLKHQTLVLKRLLLGIVFFCDLNHVFAGNYMALTRFVQSSISAQRPKASLSSLPAAVGVRPRVASCNLQSCVGADKHFFLLPVV